MTSVFCTSTSTPIDGSTRDSASTASTAWKKLAPAPPNASGISMPITPRSNSLSISSRAIFACSSMSRTRGRISRSANSYTLSRKRRSSSDSAVSAGRITSVFCVVTR
jgi:hypothetical protein